MRDDWNPEEVEATVADHFAMLHAELRGVRYSKAQHWRALQRVLRRRTKAAIERKHQNISAVLRDLGHPWIDGYKPLGNYQQLLFSAVAARLNADATLAQLVEQRAVEPAPAMEPKDLLEILEEPPIMDSTPPGLRGAPPAQPVRATVAVRRDYLALEASNRSLGRAGEQLVLAYEARRLHSEGARQLADRIEHVSVTQGDGLGFDILSFERTGRERLIEVKTTSYGKLTPFYVTRTELACSQARSDEYYVYRLYRFRSEPRLFALAGSIESTCHLDPAQFIARVA
jgi:hypothetical protein